MVNVVDRPSILDCVVSLDDVVNFIEVPLAFPRLVNDQLRGVNPHLVYFCQVVQLINGVVLLEHRIGNSK